MLIKEFKYYLKNQAKLVDKYNGKVLVIVDKKVVGVYVDKMEAYTNAIETYDAGTFLIIQCSPGTENYTFNQRSRTLATI